MTSITARLFVALLLGSLAVGAQTIDHGAGFNAPADYQLNGSARLTSSGSITLTDTSSGSQAGSLFSKTRLNINQFSTRFQFQLEPSSTGTYADGLTFTIQNLAPTALGSAGGNLGYTGIGSSLAVKVDAYQNAGDSSGTSTGYFSGGAAPFGGPDLSCCVNLRNHHMTAVLEYDGTKLTLTLSDDTAATYAVWYWTNIDIPNLIGGSHLAYVGLTGGSGASVGAEEVFNWTWRSIAPLVAVDLDSRALRQSCGAGVNDVAKGINDLGQVVGAANACIDAGTYAPHGFVWDPAQGMQDLHTGDIYQGLYLGFSSANSINDQGVVVGDTDMTVFDDAHNPQYVQAGFSWTPAGGMKVVRGPSKHVSSAPWLRAPPTPGPYELLRILGINDSGLTVGWFADVVNSAITHGAFDRATTSTSAPVWFTPAPPLSRAYAVNVHGLAVGDTGDGTSCALFDTTTGTPKNVSAGTGNQSLFAVNASGMAVGQRNGTSILWNPSSANGMNGSFIDLFATGGTPNQANGINDAGYVVEGFLNADAAVRIPSTFNDGTGVQVSLNDMIADGLVTDSTGAVFGSTTFTDFYDGRAINNLGQIVVTGSDKHAYLLSPAITPVVTTLSPGVVAAGGPAFTLTLTGSKFLSGAQVKVNGAVRTSTVLSPTQMTVQIPASDIATVGAKPITITSPIPRSTPANATLSVR